MKRFLQVISVMLIDIASYYFSLTTAWGFREHVLPDYFTQVAENFPLVNYLYFWWIPLIYIFFIGYVQAYTIRLPFWEEVKVMLNALTLSMLVVLAVVTLGRVPDKISRVIILALWLNSIVIFPLFRLCGKKLLFKIGIFREKVLILGAGRAGTLILKWLKRESHIGYEVIGFLDDNPEKIGKYIDGVKIFGKVRHYTRFVKELQINTIIISMPSLGPEKISNMAFKVQQNVKNTMIVPDLYGISLLNTELLNLFYEEIFLLKIKNNLKSPINRLVKRCFDLFFSIMLLPVLLVFIVIIGVLIKLETKGPVFYSHLRMGKEGKHFKCFKFRTMVRDAEERLKELLQKDSNVKDEWDLHWKLKKDPRITKVGGFLRKTSLDELPQVFNVLKGDMSLIGPRPYLLRELPLVEDGMNTITKVAPGITGLWQVSGRSDTTYRYRVRLDIWYIMNWSLWLDVLILLKTIKVVILMKGVR